MLVLAPTRELARQIADSMTNYSKGLGMYVTSAFGGVPINRQKRILAKGVDVLVATPGRLLDLIDQRCLTLEKVEILVLDEADQMLDLGFHCAAEENRANAATEASKHVLFGDHAQDHFATGGSISDQSRSSVGCSAIDHRRTGEPESYIYKSG